MPPPVITASFALQSSEQGPMARSNRVMVQQQPQKPKGGYYIEDHSIVKKYPTVNQFQLASYHR
ncbi:uncharacterized protein N7529_001736 [Penicillium soppii]|uniref:uncharacterized protein n=1 Tax=Penicillium soppii TaxID=69789 RepID=UPI0025499EF6|nr:uncharacterized protein N7529_001736 [Penicillium soppii]KAJ5876152.1 hypothetical protein N7529_001736 [Penicillium soppii]